MLSKKSPSLCRPDGEAARSVVSGPNDCGGAFYAPVSGGYQVITPPIGATVWILPNGAVDQNVNGVTYFSYGSAFYRPIYSGSGVYYGVVANPA